MSYEVDWVQEAENGLATIWLSATDREVIVVAADEIDKQLADDPLHLGESRGVSQRIHFQPPLMIYFRVLEAEKSVVVTSCQLIPRSRKK